MSGLFSGVGLVSGMNIQQIVDQLIAIDARPRAQLTGRIGRIDAQRTAYADVSARISALLNRVNSLKTRSIFESSSARSSNEDVLLASADPGAPTGSTTFVVRSLAAAHQLVSSGFRDGNAPLAPGTLTIESAAARVDRRTTLAELNGYRGVQRGAFTLVDASGAEATVNTSDARTLSDVVDRINQSGLDIRATVRNEALVLTETTGGQIQIREIDNGRTAADLGFATGNVTGTGSLTGGRLLSLSNATPLSALNDGNGLRGDAGGGDFRIAASDLSTFDVDLSGVIKFDTRLERLNDGQGVALGRIRITTRDGARHDIDLAGARTVGDLQTAIQTAAPDVSITLTGSRLVVTDRTVIPANADGTPGTPRDLIIEDLDGGTAARQLSIAGRQSSGTINGRDILHVDSLRSALAAINYASGNDGQIVASIAPDGERIVLTDTAGGSGRLTLQTIDGSNSHALADLGFQPGDYGRDGAVTGRRIIGGLDSALLTTLNGGQGFAGGTIRIAAGSGSIDVDLSTAETLADVVEAINTAATTAGLTVSAGLDNRGTRLVIQSTATTPGDITISDVAGTFAADTGLAQTAARITGGNLQRRYVNENTQLDTLNAGRGVNLGTIRITDRNGSSAEINLSVGRIETLQDVIDEINDAAVGVTARINDTGDGLLLTGADGPQSLRIEDVGGSAARDLNILGESTTGSIDGSYELNFDVVAGTTVDDLARQINDRGLLAAATTVNDGGSINPYRLSLASRATGLVGELLVDADALGLDFTTLSRARDAMIVVGDDPAGGVVITSSSNTIDNAIGGVTLNLTGVDDEPVTVTVERDREGLRTAVRGIVDDFNAVMDRIKNLTSFDPETEQAGALLGEGALQIVESRLIRLFSGGFTASNGSIRRLGDLGLRFGEGARLTLDEDKLNTALDGNEAAVIDYFTRPETGLAHKLKKELERLTDTGGVIDRRTTGLENQRETLNERIDAMTELLDRKRARLMRQFQAMEEALARLQSQQTALGAFASSMPTIGATGAAR